MILHIGLPRTGTTTLQKFLFSDESLFAPSRTLDQKISKFHRMAGVGIPLPDSVADIKGAINTLSEIKRSAKGKIILVSDEKITSLGNTLAVQDLYARRLTRIDSKARIIITLRQQQGLMKSRFSQMRIRKHWAALGLFDTSRQYLKARMNKQARKLMRTLFVPDFVEWSKMGMENQESCWFSVMNYFDLFNCFARIFGHQNVKVLFFEDLKQNSNHFAEQLAKFIGINSETILSAIDNTANSSPTGIRIWDRVMKNFKYPGEGINLSYALQYMLGLKTANDKNLELLDLVRTHYGRQNRKLSQLLGEDLAARGYLMDNEQ